MKRSDYTNSIFEQPWWLDLVAKDEWKEVYVKDKAGHVLARFAYVEKNGHAYTPDFTQNIGIWIREDVKKDYGSQKRIINDLFSQMKTIKSFKLTLAVENKYVLPFRWLGAKIEPRFTYRISRLDDMDALYKSFNKTVKKNINYARNKVKLCYDYNGEHLWQLYEKTFSSQDRKVPFNKNKMLEIAQFVVEKQCGRYVEAIDSQGNIHSCALFVFDKNICYYLFGAADRKFSNSGSQNLILWDGIQFASKHSKAFDFEGSMIEGIENFYRQFSGECLPYYVVSKVSMMKEVSEIIKPRIKRIIGYKM